MSRTVAQSGRLIGKLGSERGGIDFDPVITDHGAGLLSIGVGNDQV